MTIWPSKKGTRFILTLRVESPNTTSEVPFYVDLYGLISDYGRESFSDEPSFQEAPQSFRTSTPIHPDTPGSTNPPHPYINGPLSQRSSVYILGRPPSPGWSV